MVATTEGPEPVTEHSWGYFCPYLGHKDSILGLEPSKCALCQDSLSKHQKATLLCSFCFFSGSVLSSLISFPPGKSYASFKTQLVWNLLWTAIPVLSLFLAFCSPNIPDFLLDCDSLMGRLGALCSLCVCNDIKKIY